MFTDPTATPMGDKVTMDTFVNKLVVVRPREFTDKMKTEFKPDGAEAVFADIALLDPIEGEPWKIYRRVLVMQGYLVGSFKGSLGAILLGTIHYGERKTGQKPPYKFASLTGNPQAVARATEWMKAHEAEFMKDPEPVFEEPEAAAKKPTTLDSMRDNNPWLNSDEAPF